MVQVGDIDRRTITFCQTAHQRGAVGRVTAASGPGTSARAAAMVAPASGKVQPDAHRYCLLASVARPNAAMISAVLPAAGGGRRVSATLVWQTAAVSPCQVSTPSVPPMSRTVGPAASAVTRRVERCAPDTAAVSMPAPPMFIVAGRTAENHCRPCPRCCRAPAQARWRAGCSCQ